jgi:hypothetical protein
LGISYSSDKRFSSNVNNEGYAKNGNAGGGNNGGSLSNNDLLPRFQRKSDNRTNGSLQHNLTSSVYDTSSLIDDGFRERNNSSGRTFR